MPYINWATIYRQALTAALFEAGYNTGGYEVLLYDGTISVLFSKLPFRAASYKDAKAQLEKLRVHVIDVLQPEVNALLNKKVKGVRMPRKLMWIKCDCTATSFAEAFLPEGS